MRRRVFHVYVLSSPNRSLYVGLTSNLPRRLVQHRHAPAWAYARRHGISTLVYAERYDDVRDAIAREKQLKRWPRWRKDRLILAANPAWADLGADAMLTGDA